MNIFELGSKVFEEAVPNAGGHDVKMIRPSLGNRIETAVFKATSPPVTHQLITEIGLDLSEQYRIFFVARVHIEPTLGKPRIGDVVEDQATGEQYRVVPSGGDYAWKWFDQFQKIYRIITKQD